MTRKTRKITMAQLNKMTEAELWPLARRLRIRGARNYCGDKLRRYIYKHAA